MKIIFTMSDGRTYELSEYAYAGKGKFPDRISAKIQLDTILEKLSYFPALF